MEIGRRALQLPRPWDLTAYDARTPEPLQGRRTQELTVIGSPRAHIRVRGEPCSMCRVTADSVTTGLVGEC